MTHEEFTTREMPPYCTLAARATIGKQIIQVWRMKTALGTVLEIVSPLPQKSAHWKRFYRNIQRVAVCLGLPKYNALSAIGYSYEVPDDFEIKPLEITVP